MLPTGPDSARRSGWRGRLGVRLGGIAIWAVLVLQLFIAVLYLLDLTSSLTGIPARPSSWALYELSEIGIFLALVAGAVMSAALALRSQRRARRSEKRLQVAQTEFHHLVVQQFEEWRLTRSEHDVALLVIKGLSNGEIAEVLGKSEGTVKAQCNAVFRKAGVNGRPQLISGLIEDLLGGSVPGLTSMPASTEAQAESTSPAPTTP